MFKNQKTSQPGLIRDHPLSPNSRSALRTNERWGAAGGVLLLVYARLFLHMRRLVANSVLLVMLGVFFAPAMMIAAPAPTPICCRRAGAHHCSASTETANAGGNAFRANRGCPFRQASQLGSSRIALPVSEAAAANLSQHVLIGVAVSRRYFTSSYSDPQRGPPALL